MDIYDLKNDGPFSQLVVTGSSLDAANMFNIVDGSKLRLVAGLGEDRRKNFDYEKHKTVEVYINATDLNPPGKNIILCFI